MLLWQNLPYFLMIMSTIQPPTFDHSLLAGEFGVYLKQALTQSDWSKLAQPDGLQVHKRVDQMRRAGHRLLFVSWQGEPLVLKFFADYGDSRTGRRLEFILKNALTNYARRSYLGARYLLSAGVPAIEPLAYMNTSPFWVRRGVFVYREVAAEKTLGQWFADNPDDPRRTRVFMQVAEIIHRIQQARIIQPDLVKSNILVSDDGTRVHMTLIDTDDVRQLPPWWPNVLATLVFLWSLRRMRVPDSLRQAFFSVCLGGSATAGWYRFWTFIQDNNFKPWKRLLKKRAR